MVSLTDRLTAVEYCDLEAESVKVEIHYGRIPNDFAENDGLRAVFHTLMSISPGFKIGGSKSDRQVAPRRLVV